ncbi:fluoride efflux transporter CrcB [bacterium]|nr:fluoride efflux transporter CrcB [bacterium]
MKDLLAIMLGGGIGSVCRYLVSTALNRRFGGSFAWGTMTVNLLGCLLIGFLVGLVDRSILPKEYRLILVTGFLGGFTTFSSFALESVGMFRERAIGAGILNVGVNVVLGFALTIVGLVLAGLTLSRKI